MAKSSKAERDNQVVRWTGDHGYPPMLPKERHITVVDWRNAGIANKDEAVTIEFNADNNYTVPRSAFGFLSEAEFANLVEADPFLVVEQAEQPAAEEG